MTTATCPADWLDAFDQAERLHIRNLLDGAVRSGHDVAVVDLGGGRGVAFAAAAPTLPGPVFNTGNGIVTSELLGAARAHWEAHGTTGWIQALSPPWPGASPTDHMAIGFARPVDVPERVSPDGITIRTPVGGARLTLTSGGALLGAAAVTPGHRALGIQRALISYRARLVTDSGATWLGATAVPDGTSERNLAAMGFQRAALRGRYPVRLADPRH